MSYSVRKKNVVVSTSISTKNYSSWTKSGNNIFNNNPGNVGINNINPSFNLDVSGNTNLNGNLIIDGNLLTVDASNNRVGVNTPNPIYTFDVSGDIRDNNGQLLFTTIPALVESSILVSKETPYSEAFTSPDRYRMDNNILIGGRIDLSGNFQNTESYCTIIHGSSKGGFGNSYFNQVYGYGARFNAHNRPKTTVIGCQAAANEGDSVPIGFRSNVNNNGVSIGVNTGLDLSTGPFSQASTIGGQNIFLGANSGRGIILGQFNTAIGNSARFTGDVSNSLSINNQADSSVGGIYGINMGTNAFQLGINSNSPVTTLDVSGNIVTNPGSTTMSNGFVYIPAAVGIPSGNLTSIPGSVPMYADTSNNRLYFNFGGTNWRYASLT